MTVLGIALIVGGLVGFALVLRHEIRATRPSDADEDWIAPNAGWIDDHEVDREFWAIVSYQQEVP